MTVYLRKDQCCTYTDDDCWAPIYQEGLCSGHFRRWKQCGGPHPGVRVKHYSDITLNGSMFEALDMRTGSVVVSEAMFDMAADLLAELRRTDEEAA
jgi:hypothetical protein